MLGERSGTRDQCYRFFLARRGHFGIWFSRSLESVLGTASGTHRTLRWTTWKVRSGSASAP